MPRGRRFLPKAARALPLLLVVARLPAFAADSPAALPDRAGVDYAKGCFRDAAGISSSPARWDKADWLKAAAVLGSTGALYLWGDGPARKTALDNQNEAGDRLADLGGGLGSGYYLAAGLGAAYLGGEAAGSPRLRAVALYGAESWVLSGLIVNGVKVATGRARPDSGEGRDHWLGPTLARRHLSFPSGHAAAAFSVATAFAAEYRDYPLAPPLAYGAASLAALSRVYQDHHWASDAFLGSALGYFTAKAVLRRHKAGSHWTMTPMLQGRAAGLAFACRFD